MEKTAEQLYEEREKRVYDAIQLNEPVMVDDGLWNAFGAVFWKALIIRP
jgi:hypothetical protein